MASERAPSDNLTGVYHQRLPQPLTAPNNIRDKTLFWTLSGSTSWAVDLPQLTNRTTLYNLH